MGSNLDPDLLPKKRSDPIPIRSFPIFHWRSFQIFSDPFRSFPIYQPWVFTIFIIVKIYFDNIFGNWYMSKISLHQNIYHPYLIIEKFTYTWEVWAQNKYRTSANTRAVLITAALCQKVHFLCQILITTVIFGSNLNTTAPKTPGWKLEQRRSICAGTVGWSDAFLSFQTVGDFQEFIFQFFNYCIFSNVGDNKESVCR